MVAQDSYASSFDDGIDTGHVVLLLFIGAQFEVVVQTADTAVEMVTVVPRRVEELNL